MEQVPKEGRALDLDDVDIKDLLETGKVVLERSVLKEMMERHQSDHLFLRKAGHNYFNLLREKLKFGERA